MWSLRNINSFDTKLEIIVLTIIVFFYQGLFLLFSALNSSTTLHWYCHSMVSTLLEPLEVFTTTLLQDFFTSLTNLEFSVEPNIQPPQTPVLQQL